MKYFRMPYEEVVFKRSYLNLILLNRAIPSCKPLDDDKEEKEKKNRKEKNENKSVHANDYFMNFM